MKKEEIRKSIFEIIEEDLKDCSVEEKKKHLAFFISKGLIQEEDLYERI